MNTIRAQELEPPSPPAPAVPPWADPWPEDDGIEQIEPPDDLPDPLPTDEE